MSLAQVKKKHSKGMDMETRFSELLMMAGSAMALIFALFILPAIERRIVKAQKAKWVILDREFIELGKGR